MTPLPGLVEVKQIITDCLIGIRETKVPHEVLDESTCKYIDSEMTRRNSPQYHASRDSSIFSPSALCLMHFEHGEQQHTYLTRSELQMLGADSGAFPAKQDNVGMGTLRDQIGSR
jgi:hypothetical protein